MRESFFKVGDFVFRLEYPEKIIIPKNFLKFQCDMISEAYGYTIHLTNSFPEPPGIQAAERHDVRVYKDGDLEIRCQRMYSDVETDCFSCIWEDSPVHTTIYLKPWILSKLTYDTVFSSLFVLERRLILRNALILHSSYIRYREEAILFSAPSGTGKSTQAGLWETYRSVRQINGDRSLLQKIGDRWCARGWPVCGSSEICHVADTPIKAIVMLSQGTTNELSLLSPAKAFSQIYSQITINRWNNAFQINAMNLIENIITEIPVYHYTCTISKNAVECLEQALYQS